MGGVGMRPLGYPDSALRSARIELIKNENPSFDYDYPIDGLKPGDELHGKLVDYVLELVQNWERKSSDYRDDLRKLQWTLTGYVNPDDANPRNTTKDKNNVIVLPMTHRNRHMMHAAWHSVFIRNPIWRVKAGCGPAAMINAASMEYAIEQQVQMFDAGLHLHTAVDDALMGRATLGTEFTQKRGRKPVDTVITDVAVEMFKAIGGNASAQDKNTILREFKDAILFEGTQLRPWDPFRTIRDPNVSVNFYQEAEYGGRTYDTNINKMIAREMDDASYVRTQKGNGIEAKPRYFNARYVKILADAGISDSYWNGEFLSTGRNDRTGLLNSLSDQQKTTSVCPIYLEMQIIPKEWKVGDEDYPVKYFIEVSADLIITGFGPLDYGDGNYSWVEFGPNTTGHEIEPVGDLMVNFGSHKFANSMMNLVEADYRKSVNGGVTVINQDLIDMEHYLNQNTAHKLAMWAKPFVSPEEARTAFMNFPHMSRSAEHLSLITQLMQWDSDGIGTSNIMQDIGAERPTVPGVQMAKFQQNSRMQVWCWKFAKQGMQDLFWRYAYNIVQFSTLPIQARYQGMWADKIRRELGKAPDGAPWEIDMESMSATVDPRQMSLEFQMEPFTGDMPNMADPSGLGNILQQALGIPEIAAETFSQFPIANMFRSYLRMIDAPDIDSYETQAPAQMGGSTTMQTMPDEALQQQIQAGNMVPIPMGDRGYA